jgi:hypothetical protein
MSKLDFLVAGVAKLQCVEKTELWRVRLLQNQVLRIPMQIFVVAASARGSS